MVSLEGNAQALDVTVDVVEVADDLREPPNAQVIEADSVKRLDVVSTDARREGGQLSRVRHQRSLTRRTKGGVVAAAEREEFLVLGALFPESVRVVRDSVVTPVEHAHSDGDQLALAAREGPRREHDVTVECEVRSKQLTVRRLSREDIGQR